LLNILKIDDVRLHNLFFKFGQVKIIKKYLVLKIFSLPGQAMTIQLILSSWQEIRDTGQVEIETPVM